MKLKTNWKLTKEPRKKIRNKINEDQSWNISKWEDNCKILNS